MRQGPVQGAEYRDLAVDSVLQEIFGDEYEFWKQATPDTFREAIRTLLSWGVPKDVIASVLSSTSYAIREEYGD